MTLESSLCIIFFYLSLTLLCPTILLHSLYTLSSASHTPHSSFSLMYFNSLSYSPFLPHSPSHFTLTATFFLSLSLSLSLSLPTHILGPFSHNFVIFSPLDGSLLTFLLPRGGGTTLLTFWTSVGRSWASWWCYANQTSIVQRQPTISCSWDLNPQRLGFVATHTVVARQWHQYCYTTEIQPSGKAQYIGLWLRNFGTAVLFVPPTVPCTYPMFMTWLGFDIILPSGRCKIIIFYDLIFFFPTTLCRRG